MTEPKIVTHKDLERYSPHSILKSKCLKCTDGMMLMVRNDQTFELNADDYCVYCGQQYIYEDIEDVRKLDSGIEIEQTYLGDSVYASFDGWMIKLTTNNGYDATNVIYLDPETVRALESFSRMAKLKAANISSPEVKLDDIKVVKARP